MSDTNAAQLNNTHGGAEPWCHCLIVVHILTLCRSYLLLKPSEACIQRDRVLCGKAVDLELGGLGSCMTPPRSLSFPHCSVL